ncbi:hypothetical protein EVAR_32426_1 [Eumeta japonica]|uniref:Uncharacterized protein n=1 Tax=Eumeta variegata TaxID=151549 RepID=A0A4C1VNP0_EUMVA|nr:hypothetical protein EVAR_32426_1 [Eumeta japonica]
MGNVALNGEYEQIKMVWLGQRRCTGSSRHLSCRRSYVTVESSIKECTLLSNLQRSKLATTELLIEAERQKIAIVLVWEPYVGNTGECRQHPGCRSSKRRFSERDPT